MMSDQHSLELEDVEGEPDGEGEDEDRLFGEGMDRNMPFSSDEEDGFNLLS